MPLRVWLKSVFQQITSTRRSLRRRHTRGSVPVACLVERLEPRQLLSAALVGPEIVVNTTTAGTQETNSTSGNATAMDAAGNFVLTWISQDGSGKGIYAQRFNANGVAQGGEFLVNTTTTGDQDNPAIAMDSSGDFVITWTSSDGGGTGVYAQRYNSAGVAQGSEFLVNTSTSGDQRNPAIAMDSSGNFVIVWENFSQEIHFQRYNSAGVAQGGESSTSTAPGYYGFNKNRPSVSMNATGSFVISWEASGFYAPLFVQQFNSAGTPQSGAIRVNFVVDTSNSQSSVSIDDAGNFVVAYVSTEAGGGIFARRFKADSTPQGNEFLVNTTPGGSDPSISKSPGGEFVISWTSGGGILAQSYASTGAKDGGEFQLGSSGARSTVVIGPDGQAVGIWTTNTDVHAQRFVETVFLSGSTLRITGTDNADIISVGQINPTTLVVNFNGASSTFDPSQVTAISIKAQGGNDTITIGSTVSLPATVDAGAGNDLISAGAGNETLAGGTGDDTYVFGNAAAAQTITVVELAGQGSETLNFASVTTAITANLTSDAALAVMTNRTIQTGAAGQAANFENITGGSAGDTLTGNDADNILVGLGGADALSGGNGNDGLTGGAANDTLNGGAGNDSYFFVTNAASGSDTIADSTGIDTTDFTGSTNAVVLNLGLTTAQVVNSNLTLTLNSATSIENLYGGSDNDTLTGNTLDNVIQGGAGSDTMAGGAGGDTYLFANAVSNENDKVIEQAGQGIDTLSFAAMTDSVTALLSSDFALASMTNRRVVTGSGQALNFENAIGGAGADVLVGNSGNNTLTGGDGADVLQGGDGNDYLNGGNGDDSLNGGNGVDYLSGVDGADKLTGGSGDDTLVGGNGDDNASGGTGSDTYLFANAGNSEVDTVSELAGEGIDTLSFAGMTSAVTALLSSDDALAQMTNRRVVTGASEQADNFENLTGGSGNDILFGNASNNVITGGAGNDVEDGEAGNDTYSFNTSTALGSDQIEDSSGVDTLFFGGSSNNVTVNLGLATPQVVNANLTLTLNTATTIENATGGNGNDIIIGNTLANVLTGGAGNDVLTGRGNNDILNGGDGNNILIGGDSGDQLIGGNNSDLLIAATYQSEQDPTALAALLAEWASADSYSDRIARLEGTMAGGANGSFTLTQATVTEDGDPDTLTGGAGQDWFIGTTPADSVTDKAVDEVFTQISSLP